MKDESDAAIQRQFLREVARALAELAAEPDVATASASPAVTHAYAGTAEGEGTAYDATILVTLGGLTASTIDPTLVERAIATLKPVALAAAGAILAGPLGDFGSYRWDQLLELIKALSIHH